MIKQVTHIDEENKPLLQRLLFNDITALIAAGITVYIVLKYLFKCEWYWEFIKWL